jgi:RND superfamily putative drug exporter
MTMTAAGRHANTPSAPDPDLGYRPGPLGRLGVGVSDHARLTSVVWILLIVGLGAFAPKVESQLSGAGWQADGSESVATRQLAQDRPGTSPVRTWWGGYGGRHTVAA